MNVLIEKISNRCRAKTLLDREWTHGYFIRDCEDRGQICHIGGSNGGFGVVIINRVDETTVVHPTGRYDKDGEELWEGDIIQRKFPHTPFVGVVVFRRGEFVIRVEQEDIPLGKLNDRDIKVIGSVYDDNDYCDNKA